mmetsp:Transcript_3990/g.18287  ORF Transcript_3990/g.18287 Transcript_3990/m.18287 type:complete len:208 (+) Transcript_3990:146-769(+)
MMPVQLLRILQTLMHKHQLRGQVVGSDGVVIRRHRRRLLLRVPLHREVPDTHRVVRGRRREHRAVEPAPLHAGHRRPVKLKVCDKLRLTGRKHSEIPNAQTAVVSPGGQHAVRHAVPAHHVDVGIVRLDLQRGCRFVPRVPHAHVPVGAGAREDLRLRRRPLKVLHRALVATVHRVFVHVPPPTLHRLPYVYPARVITGDEPGVHRG